MKAILIFLVLALTGCANIEGAIKATSEGNAAIQVAHAKQEATPLLDLELYEDGRMKKLVVGRQLGAPAFAPMPVDPTIQVWDRALTTIGIVAAPLAAMKGASWLADSVGKAAGQGYKYVQSPQAPVVVQPAVTPQANVTTTNTTLSGTGVLGSGSYSAPTTTTTTLSGTGVIGNGSYSQSTPTTNTLNGNGVMGSGSYVPTNNSFTGNGVLGSGSYTPTQTTTANTLSGSGTVGGGSYTPSDRHDSYTSTPTVVQVPAGRICTTDAKGVTTCQ